MITTENTTTTTATKKRGRKPANKVPYRSADAPLLTEWPTDWDSSNHQPLTVDDFCDECQYIYWDHRAAVYRKRMEEAEAESALCRKYGSAEQRAKVLQMQKLAASLEALKAELGDLAL